MEIQPLNLGRLKGLLAASVPSPFLVLENGQVEPATLKHLPNRNIRVESAGGSTKVDVGDQQQLLILEIFSPLLNDHSDYESTLAINLHKGASATHYSLQVLPNRAQHTAKLGCMQAEGSQFSTYHFLIGAEQSTTQIKLELCGQGVDSAICGLIMGHDQQTVKFDSLIDHQQPRGTSTTVVKGIFDDESKGIINGKVIVQPGAQLAASSMLLNNLLLSKQAQAKPRPELEIYNDDVKCSHGATVGRLDEQSLFYLRSRGIAEKRARDLLVHAFVQEIIDRVALEALRTDLTSLIDKKLVSNGIPS